MRDLIVITGSSGLIGGATARRLALDHDIIGLDNDPPRDKSRHFEHVHIDVTKDDSVETALKYVQSSRGRRIASFIHLAAYYDFSGEPSSLYDEVTVRGTERLLRRLQRFDVEQLIYSSSVLVHAPCQRGQRINEDWPLEPKWDYPVSKVAAETALRAQRGHIPVAILRIAGVYDDTCHSIPIAHQIQRIFENQLIARVYPGDLESGQPFVHLDDVVDALARLVARRRTMPAELTLLIGEPETLSYDRLQRELSRLLHGEEWETRTIPKAVAKAGAWLQDQLPGEEPFIKPWMIDLADDHLELDITRARTVLGWSPKHALRATLPAMIEALRSDPIGWYRTHKLEVPGWLEERVASAHPPVPDRPAPAR